MTHRLARKAIGLAVSVALVFSFLAAISTPVTAVPLSNPTTAAPVWVVFTAEADGNYPGGTEFFSVVAVNSDPNGNVTFYSASVTTPFFNNTGLALPASFATGYAYATTIAIPIPTDFTGSNFTANLVVKGEYPNGTASVQQTWTGFANVYVFALPSSHTSTTTSQASSSGTVPTSTFAIGIALPSIVAVVLLVLLVRARPGPKKTGP